MEATDTTQKTIWEDQDVTNMARLQVNGSNITQSSLSGGSIVRKIFNEDSATPDTALSTDTLTIGDVVFDTLQTDARWDTDADTTGYNFRDRIAGTKFATGDVHYRVEYQFTGASSELFMLVFQHRAKAVRGS